MQPQNTNTIAPAQARTQDIPVLASTVPCVRGVLLEGQKTNDEQNNTCVPLQNGNFRIIVDGIIIRKQSKRSFAAAYVFGNGKVVLSNDGQLRRIYGEPKIVQLGAK